MTSKKKEINKYPKRPDLDLPLSTIGTVEKRKISLGISPKAKVKTRFYEDDDKS